MQHNSHFREILHGASLGFLLRVVGAGLGFVFNWLLARQFGAEGSGLFFLTMTVVGLVAMFSRLGLESVVLREVAAHAGKSQWGEVAAISRSALELGSISGLVGTLLLLLAAYPLARWGFAKPELQEPLLWGSLMILPMMLLTFYGEMLKGLKRIVESQLVQMIAVPSVALGGLMLLQGQTGSTVPIWAQGGGTLVAAALGAWLWRQARQPAAVVPGHGAATLLHSGIPLMWVGGLTLLVSSADTMLLGIFRPAHEVGIYGIASRTVALVGFALVAVNNIAGPKFAELYRTGDMHGLNQAASSAMRINIAVTLPFLAVLFIAPDWVLKLFGHEFSMGGGVLAILALGQFINVITGPVGQLLIMTGNERGLRNVWLWSAGINLILNLALIPSQGMIGAAIANCIGVSVGNVLSVFLVRKRVGLKFGFASPRIR